MFEETMSNDLYFLRWSINKTYILFGASETIVKFRNAFDFEIDLKCIVDNSKEKQNKYFGSLKVNDPSYLNSIKNECQIIITAPSIKAQIQIKEQLESMGFIEGQNFTTYTKLMMVWKWYTDRSIAVNYTEVMITSKCNLKCQNCGLYIPCYENQEHRTIESINRDLDSYFKVIDYVSEFRLLGGEPLIYPEIVDLITIIGEKYRAKIGEFVIVTNGIAAAKCDLITVMKKFNVVFHISDYSNTLPQIRKSIGKLIIRSEEAGITYKRNSSNKWLDLGSPFNSRKLSKKQLIEKFNRCKMPCRSLYNQKMFYCGPLSSAVMARIYSSVRNDYFDLSEAQYMSKEEKFNSLLNFELGNTQMGYITFCDFCNGFGCDNTFYVEPGVQIEM
ncbi:MAG: radical SAM protein [Acetobacterium woodii]|nr:radical SAM protein [Acetobacterium woodii]